MFALCAQVGIFSFVKVLFAVGGIMIAGAAGFAGSPSADSDAQTSAQRQRVVERAVFVTGSLIPQRIQLRPVGTTTSSPIRIIDRREIDQTGRQTTPGAFVNEPSLRVLGH